MKAYQVIIVRDCVDDERWTLEVEAAQRDALQSDHHLIAPTEDCARCGRGDLLLGHYCIWCGGVTEDTLR